MTAGELTIKIREQFVLLPSNQSIVHLN